jgi:hypothetical protein
MNESMGRRATINGDEVCAFAPKATRDKEPAFDRAGVRAKAKRGVNRRSRHAAKASLRFALAGE